MSFLDPWKQRARQLKLDAFTLYLACRDPRVPWPVRLLALAIAGYAFSPIDLIPDWIPVLGYLDDLLIVPLGIALVVRLIPSQILAENRGKAQALIALGKPVSRIAAGFIIALWIGGAYLAIMLIRHATHK